MGAVRLLNGLIFGAMVGAAAVLLLTPRSGEDFQRLLRERADFIIEESRRAATERRAELEAQFAQAKRPPHTAS